MGTHVLANKNGSISRARVEALATGLCEIKATGTEVILVTSGAVGAGLKALGLKKRPEDLPTLQACAAAGQTVLMDLYTEFFSAHKVKVGQILATHEDIRSRKRFLNARNTIERLLELGAVPIINENDSVAVDEIRFGDNDMLSALTANLVRAELLVILTTVDGFYESFNSDGKNGKPIDSVTKITKKMLDSCKIKTGTLSIGGMASKLKAVSTVVNAGEMAVIANGTKKDILKKIMAGKEEGTFFVPAPEKLSSKKRWLAFFAKPSGTLVLDDGAVNALIKRGSSLLPGGVTEVDGTFEKGDTISLTNKNGEEIGRGISNYSSQDTLKIKGCKTKAIALVLGKKSSDELIHRNDMVILAQQ